MIENVKKFIINNSLSGKKILLGFSGGADSVTLADILSRIKDELDLKLVFIHLNHNWRGIEAKNDEAFCKNFAAKKNIPFYSETLELSVKQNETAAREARYAFFESCREKFNADAVFLAHNMNDNIETVLYRLIKGTGPAGLCGIPMVRDFYFRPLLNTKRTEINAYIKKNGLNHTVDRSNFDIVHKRNLIRKEIIPGMREINKKFEDAFQNFFTVNEFEQKIVRNALKNVISDISEGKELLRDKFLLLDTELQYEVVNTLVTGILKNRDFKSIDKIVNFIRKNEASKMSLNKELFLKVYNNKIYFYRKVKTPSSSGVPLKIGKNYFLNKIITVEECLAPELFPNDNRTYYLNLDFSKKYMLRTRQKGDKIIPFGKKSYQKIKDIFINKKIKSECRAGIPLIECEGEILLIAGVLASEKLRVEKNQKICYKLVMDEA